MSYVFDRFELGCVRFFDRWVASEGHHFVHVCESAFLSCRAPCGVPTLCAVPDILDTLFKQR